MLIFPQDTFHPQIVSYLFRVESESNQHFEGKQIIRLISWPWIPTRSRISRGPPLTHFSPFLSPQSAGVNLFAQNPITWRRRENPYVFPPFNIMGRTLKFLLHTGISFTIVVPNLPVKPFWWPTVFSAASDEFVLCREREKSMWFYMHRMVVVSARSLLW